MENVGRFRRLILLPHMFESVGPRPGFFGHGHGLGRRPGTDTLYESLDWFLAKGIHKVRVGSIYSVDDFNNSGVPSQY